MLAIISGHFCQFSSEFSVCSDLPARKTSGLRTITASSETKGANSFKSLKILSPPHNSINSVT